jgi:hypothetical protein
MGTLLDSINLGLGMIWEAYYVLQRNAIAVWVLIALLAVLYFSGALTYTRKKVQSIATPKVADLGSFHVTKSLRQCYSS